MSQYSRLLVGVTVHADEGGEDDLYPCHPLLYVERHTIDLLRRVGLEPCLIPVYRDGSLPPLDHLKALVITGGGYLKLSDPNSQLSHLGSTGQERYEVERKLIEYGINKGLPMIGFCRGAQMINEVLGGSLENITDEDNEHHQERDDIPADQTVHSIVLAEESDFISIMKEKTLQVNSFHRQHMGTLGEGLRVAAMSQPDQIVEAFESKTHPFLFGFQFHPEKMCEKHPIWNKFFEEFSRFVFKKHFN